MKSKSFSDWFYDKRIIENKELKTVLEKKINLIFSVYRRMWQTKHRYYEKDSARAYKDIIFEHLNKGYVLVFPLTNIEYLRWKEVQQWA